jgi:hypothetical protein
MLRRLQPRAPARPPAAPIPETEAIVVSLDDYREGLPPPVRPSIPALRQA